MAMATSSAHLPPRMLLHGDLDLTIHEARDLPNMDVLSTFLRRFCLSTRTPRPRRRSISGDGDETGRHHHLQLHRHRHRQQPHGKHLLPTSDPYAAVLVDETTLARTYVVRNSDAPEWSVRILLPLAHEASHLVFQVRDDDPFGSDLIGTAKLTAVELMATAEEPLKSVWLDLLRPDGRGRPRPDSSIRVSVSFTPASGTPRPCAGVPAYFPLRRGCEVKLYQDAHVAAGELAGVPGVYEPGRCWEDMCMAVLGAQHLVYVVGWSVNTRVRLLRDAMSPAMAKKAADVAALSGEAVEKMTLGELLKFKSQEGVRVCLLVWDDKTSHDKFFLRTGGLMQTGDEETKKFFKHSSVICVLSPRYPSNFLSMAKQKIVGTLYTHHQKCLLVDTPASETTRRITAFLGGLDLAAGRYDTPAHKLFEGLDGGDMYNPTFGADARGPRQPWHDMHCRLDGPAAYDVLKNFEQRWRKAAKRLLRKSASHSKDDALLKLERIPWILSPAASVTAAGACEDSRYRDLRVLPEDDAECWHAQVFRSVDSGSVQGFPRSWERQEMDHHHLLCDKNLAVDQSIHTAYIRAIRSARRFIYVENQYFIGSSYAWPSYKNPGATNLVPMEIALKVASKISAGETFAVYVVVPMWPEGVPSSGPIQEILFWQSQTMEMMYRVIARAIQDNNLQGAHPQDYLNFYCLGKREEMPAAADHHGRAPNHPDSTNPAALARRHRRFMIYVHSKGMIVDDEYVIVGSANINQRSLAGSRDTEIAVGSYQPHHTGGRARGKVYGYRMSLWEEHLGRMGRPELETPESPACVKLVNRIAQQNWSRYADEQKVAKLQGHLMRYPVEVRDDGKVEALSGHEFFPDVGGRVLGSTNQYLDALTM